MLLLRSWHPACQADSVACFAFDWVSGLPRVCLCNDSLSHHRDAQQQKTYNVQTSSRAALQQLTSCICFPVMLSAAHVYLCDDSPKGHTETYNGQTFGTAALHQQMIDALYQDHGIPIIRVTRNKTPGGETNPKSSNLNNCLRQIYGDSIPPPAEVRTTSFDLLNSATTSVHAHSQVIQRPGGGLHNLRDGVAAQHALARGQAPLSVGQLVHNLWRWAAPNMFLSSSLQPALLAGRSSL